MVPPPSDTKVFESRSPSPLLGIGLIVAGFAFLGLLGVVFVKQVNTPARPGVDDSTMPGMIGGASVLGIGMMVGGIFMLRTTRRVMLDPQGVHSETLFSRRSVPWTDIGRVERDKQPLMLGIVTQKVIRLVGRNDKKLMTIAESVNHFDILERDIASRSATATGQVTFDPVADEQRVISRENRKMKWVAALFGLMTLGMGAGLIAGINEERHKRLFATEGVTVDAKIVQARMYNVTPRVEYSFTDDQGRTFSKDVMVYQGPEWDAVQKSQTIPVVYLKSDPSWNHLVRGQQPEPEFGGKFLFICGGGILMFGTLFVISLLGFDLKSENGVTSLTRRGRVIKQWGQATS
jgi:hypothetical protein